MAGKGGARENAGRKGYAVEIQAKRAVDLSFSTIIKVLEDESLDIELRLKAALPLAAKYFPSKLEVNDINQLTGEQKYALLSDYMRNIKSVKVIERTEPIDV